MKEAIRHFITTQARVLFENKGYKNTTMEDIAHAAAISKPTIYKYFTNKEVLLLNVVDQMNSEMEDILNPIFSSTSSFVERLREIIEKLLRHIHANRGIFRLALSEARIILQALGEKHEGIDWFIKKRAMRLHQLEEFFAQGIHEGAVRADYTPQFLAHFFVGSLNEYHLGGLLHEAPETGSNISELSDAVMNVMTEGFITRKAASGESNRDMS